MSPGIGAASPIPRERKIAIVTLFFENNAVKHTQGEALIQQALTEADDTQQMQYDTAIAFQNLAVFFNRKNDLTRATQLYLKALQHYPNYPLVLYSLGRIYIDQHKTPQAIETFMTLGQVYVRIDHYADARLSYQAVLQLSPGHPNAKAKLQNISKK